MQFDPIRLQKYVKKTDRTHPLFFTGRAHEMAIAQRSLDNLKDGDTEGNTVIFQGAPGAGKTALLNHIKANIRDKCDTATLRAPLIESPGVALFDVFEQLDPERAERAKTEHRTTKQGGVDLKVVGGEIGVSSLSVPEDIKTVQQLMGLRQSDKPLVLFLDEAQNAVGDLSNGRSSVLRTLHEGGVGNVFLVAGGLSGTSAKLRTLGVSRLASENKRTLQPLHEDEIVASLEAFLNNKDFGIDSSGYDIAPLKRLVVDECMGWPQHLTNTLRSLGEELIGTDGQLGACDLNAIQRRSEALRAEYYLGRTEGIPSPLLRELINTVPENGGVDPFEIYKMIERAYADEPRLEKMLPSDDAYEELVRRGVVQEDASGNLTIPIPSMRSYIEQRVKVQEDQEGAPSGGAYHEL